VDVVVRNPDGQTDTLPAAFTYQATPAAVDAIWVVPDLAAALTTGAGGQVEAFQAGGLYVNAHTTGHPTGELRGQLDQDGTIRLASLDATQESDAFTSTAFGAGILQVNTTTGRMRGFVITSGLTSITNAHVHRALRTTPPTPGDVVIDLVKSDANRDLWLVPDTAPVLTAEQVTAFLAGELYYNVHTTAHPLGEIRGQLDKAGTIRLATLNGVQESTAFTTSAFGAGIMAVDEATGLSAGFAVTSGLADVTDAHVHQSARTTPTPTPGGVVVGMKSGPNLAVIPDQPTALSTTPTTGGVANFLLGNLYFNVHSTAHPLGEIRGQLDKAGEVRVTAMSGAQEGPTPVTTTAVGAGLIGVDATTGRPSGFIVTRGLVSPSIAHIHPGTRGNNGTPITDLDGP